MFDFDIVTFFSGYAYQPTLVYSFIVLFMTASSFGLPIPEEMTLVSAGLVAYMAHHPDLFPPPYPGAHGVNNSIGQKRFNKINKLFHKYSYWACGLFRFTPGIRFPGHMTCGLMGIPLWKFLLVDGMAALISVPTQVILVATYGEVILAKIKEFKLILAAIIAIVVIVWLVKYFLNVRQKRRERLG